MFIFENQGTNTYLVYEVGAEDTLDNMSLGMLTNNKIPGLASTLFTQRDSTKYVKYNVSAKISVSQFFSGAVNKKRLIGVFSGIVDAMLSAEDYMIDPNSILLDLDYIFADVSSCECVLICLPILKDNEQINLAKFFKDIMFSTQFDQTENCDYVAKIINYLNSAPVFSLENFKSLLVEIKNDNPAYSVTQKSQPVAQANPVNQVRTNSPQTQPVANNVPIQKPNNTQVKKTVNETVPQTVTQPQKVKAEPGNVNVPIQQPVSVKSVETRQPTQNNQDKKISMFGLLMHYSKENADLYKAQKAAKKGKAQITVESKTNAPRQATSNSFAVPGAPVANTGFAIPGQQAPVTPVANSGFAIPGQQAPATPVAKQSREEKKPKTQTQNPQPFVQQQNYQTTINQTQAAPQSKSMNFGETTVLGGGIGETTVLNATPVAPQEVTPHLLRLKNNEKIMLNKPVFRIGKERSYVDYFVADNTAVSRSHANVISRDGEYFIVDTNSKNHTYVNGAMIQSNTETKIGHGDKIRLANEDFEFVLY